MLKLDPDLRPSARNALDMVRKNRNNGMKRRNVTEDEQPNEGISHNFARSAVYKFDVANITLSPITTFAANIRIKQVSYIMLKFLRVTNSLNKRRKSEIRSACLNTEVLYKISPLQGRHLPLRLLMRHADYS